MNKPTVVVMLATFNGLKWIDEQINSILEQQDVNVKLLVSDDNSTDGTYEWLIKRAEQDQRISLLPKLANIQLGAAGNFYRLLRSVDNRPSYFYALSDQDDIWYTNKLIDQCNILSEQQYDATSSNVNALWSDGSTHLIKKSQRQRRYDYFFESAGPGCTYCFNAKVLSIIKQDLQNLQQTELPNLHDWFIYAVCRVNEVKWWIDPKPQLAYRQHHLNEVGAHSGWYASWTRFKLIFIGEYRQEVIKLARIFAQHHGSHITSFCKRLTRMNLADRWFLFTHAHQLRRKKQDRFILAILIMCYIY